ncbi:hypothetical protein RRG08_022694 [Elysia crispata]|uniref:Uncharacterized protein n=1 Tax=Elysia crispata TaxID=231223 RepID=A0AAE0ZDZ7_9GAST|nr:hypothetical protein RRG08_022694 [Elysia crispata]
MFQVSQSGQPRPSSRDDLDLGDTRDSDNSTAPGFGLALAKANPSTGQSIGSVDLVMPDYRDHRSFHCSRDGRGALIVLGFRLL